MSDAQAASPQADLLDMGQDRAKAVVARAIALLVAIGLFSWPEAFRAADFSVPQSMTNIVVVAFRYTALAWISLAIGPWPQLASRISWWPGDDPHNLYGLAAVLLAICGAGGLIFTFLFIPGCIILAITGKLTAWWLAGAVVSLAGGVLGAWASPRLQVLADTHDRKHAA